MVLPAVVLLSFCVGLTRAPWWTVLCFPVASIAWAVYSVAHEPPNYDMPGFGYAVGIALAVICVLAWLAGRGLAALSRRRDPGAAK